MKTFLFIRWKLKLQAYSKDTVAKALEQLAKNETAGFIISAEIENIVNS
jgi:hypothetical protein